MTDGEPGRCAAWPVPVAVAAVVLLRLELPPYDDALFFVRFARNLLDHGVFAWNPADGPVHGNTSQLFQLASVPLVALGGSHSLLLGRLFSACCLVGAALVMQRRWRGAALVSVLSWLSPVALATVLSGMETALVLLLGVVFLAVVDDPKRPVGASATAALVLLCALGRPDTLLLTMGTLAVRRRFSAMALSGLGLAGLLLFFHLAYGSALPLSFYVKSGLSELTDPAFLARSHQARLRHALLFLFSTWPLWVICTQGLQRCWRQLAPAGLFLGWQLFMTVDVMGLHGRFFVPALPWLAVAAVQAWPAWRQRAGFGSWGVVAAGMAGVLALGIGLDLLPLDQGWAIGRISSWVVGAWAAAALIALSPTSPLGSDNARAWVVATVSVVGLSAGPGQLPSALPDDDALVATLRNQVTSWRGAEQLQRCLPPDLHLFHSEIGVLGLMFPDAHITDLGGLMSPELTRGGGDLDALCRERRPDAFFLPHRNYRALNAGIAASHCLEGYTRVVEKSSSPLYLRDDLLDAYTCEDAAP